MRSGTLWLAMLNPLLSLAMSILLLSLVLKRNFFMRMEKCGSATNHSSSRQSKTRLKDGKHWREEKMLVAQPCCSEYQGPIFLPIQFFSPFQSATHFSISHTGCYKLHFESIEIFVFFIRGLN